MSGTRISIEQLGEVLDRELFQYSKRLTERVNQLSDAAVKQLVKRTKATAPVGDRNGRFRSKISSTRLRESRNGDTYVWFVKAPEHRLTHLLVHGHATKNGGRTSPHPFLANALNEVFPAYENAVLEALKE